MQSSTLYGLHSRLVSRYHVLPDSLELPMRTVKRRWQVMRPSGDLIEPRGHRRKGGKWPDAPYGAFAPQLFFKHACRNPPSRLVLGGRQIGRYLCARTVRTNPRPPKRVSPTGIDDVDDVRQSGKTIGPSRKSLTQKGIRASMLHLPTFVRGSTGPSLGLDTTRTA